MHELYTASGEVVLKTRVGRSIGRTVYAQVGDLASKDDVLIGVMDTRELAAAVVDAMNVMLVAIAATQLIKEADPEDELLENLKKSLNKLDDEDQDLSPHDAVVYDLERMGTQIRKLTARVHDLEHPNQLKTIHHVPSRGEDVRVEPPPGSVVVDEGDIAWTRGAESLWYSVGTGQTPIDWEAMRWRGLLTLVHRGADE